MAKKTETTEKTVKKNQNVHEVVVKIEGDSWTKAMDKAFEEKVKNVTVDGFRKGKVPRNVFEKKFGKESLYFEAADHVLQEAYEKALEDSKLIPVVQPAVDLKSIDESGVEFSFKIVTKPEVTVKKYKGLKVTKEEVKVTKEEIDHELGHLLERYEEAVTKEGKIENGNIAVIDFLGKKDGVAFDGGKGENYSLEIGSNAFIPGFEEQLIGLKAGETKEIEVTFPEEYPSEELKGQKATFEVTIHEVKEKKQRELDKDFFEDLGMEGIDSEESLRKELEENIKAQKEMDAENKYVDRLMEEVGKNTEVDIPEEMVEEETDRLVARFEEQMKMQGVSLDLYYQITKSSEKDLRAQMEKEAFSHVLYRLMLEEIMNLEKVEISEEEANKEAEELAKRYQMEKEAFLSQFGGLDMIKYDLEMRKVIELLKEYNR